MVVPLRIHNQNYVCFLADEIKYVQQTIYWQSLAAVEVSINWV